MRGTWRVSIRRAYDVLQFRRSTYHYKSRRPSQAGLRKRIREIAETRVRYGYRRIHVLLEREGWQVNHKRVYRLYVEEGLQIRNKRPKRKVSAKLREDRKAPTAPNQVWAMDPRVKPEDMLPLGSAVRWLEDPYPGDCRCLLEVVASDRCAAALQRLRRCRYAGAGDRYPRYAEEHSCRQRSGVHLEGSRSLGLEQRRDAGLLPARQADGQCLRGIVQWKGSGLVHLPELVPVAGRCAFKMRGLSERVQRGTTAQRHREQDPGGVHEVHRAPQPRDGLKNGKFGLRPVQRSGQGQLDRQSKLTAGTNRGGRSNSNQEWH